MKTEILDPESASSPAVIRDRHDESNTVMRGRIRRASGRFDFTALLTGVQAQPEPPVELPEEAPWRISDAPPVEIPVQAVPLDLEQQVGPHTRVEVFPPVERSIVPRRQPVLYATGFRRRFRLRVNWFLVTRFGFCVWIMGMAFAAGMSGGALVEARTQYRVLTAQDAPAKAKPKPKVSAHRSRARRARTAARPAIQKPAPVLRGEKSGENHHSILLTTVIGLGFAGLVWAFWVPGPSSVIGRGIQTCLLVAIILAAAGTGVLATMLSVEQHRHQTRLEKPKQSAKKALGRATPSHSRR